MKKFVYNFSSKESSNLKKAKSILGGKGANLAEMGKLGLPVPPGFTISTEVCELFYKNKKKLNSKIIKKSFGKDVISIYKRSSNILYNEKENSLEIIGSADPGLFKNDFEKNLYKKINDIRKYFSSVGKSENYEESLKILSMAKNDIDAFFDNVIVNDKDPSIKKNRCKN